LDKPNADTRTDPGSIYQMRFGEYLQHALGKAGMSQSEFAKKARYSQANINKIARDIRQPPLARLEAWADVLANHIQRDVFLELGRLEHSPPEIRDLVAKLRHQLGKEHKLR
jgi:transcriptional regulator with XRE-family HTH domain